MCVIFCSNPLAHSHSLPLFLSSFLSSFTPEPENVNTKKASNMADAGPAESALARLSVHMMTAYLYFYSPSSWLVPYSLLAKKQKTRINLNSCQIAKYKIKDAIKICSNLVKPGVDAFAAASEPGAGSITMEFSSGMCIFKVKLICMSTESYAPSFNL